MITNIIATILITIVTNTYAPKQYLDTSYGCLVYGCKADHSQWMDSPAWIGGFENKQKRDNPDVRITEVHQTRTLSFEFEGKVYLQELSDVVVSTVKKRKVVVISEPTYTNGMTVVTTVERWEVLK